MKRQVEAQHALQWQEIATALRNRISVGKIENPGFQSINEFLAACEQVVKLKLNENLRECGQIRNNVELKCVFVIKKGEEEKLQDIYFISKMALITMATNLDEYLAEVKENLLRKMQEFSMRESGKALYAIPQLQVNIAKCDAINGGSYIPLPKWIENTKAVINIQNFDDYCFAYCLMYHVNPPQHHAYRVSNYRNPLEAFNFQGIEFPVEQEDWAKFEKQNPGISINIYGVDDNKICGPLYFSQKKKDVHANLLLLRDGDRTHYCYIKNLSRLCCSQLNKSHQKKYICDRCLAYFHTEALLVKHEELCRNFDSVHLKLPEEGENILKFKAYEKKEFVPFTVFADFESFLKPIDSNQPDEHASYSMDYQRHIPYAVAMQVVCQFDDRYNSLHLFRGENCVQQFLEKLKELAAMVEDLLGLNVPMVFADKNYDNCVKCHICGKNFKDDDKIVRDHCHFTGKFRGFAHNACNLNYQRRHFIPVYLHNGSNYDFHFIIPHLADDDGRINVIPINSERYFSLSKQFGKMTIRFLDSLKFMQASLEELANNLDKQDMHFTRQEFPDDVDFDLISRKGIFCYDYVTDWNVLDEDLISSKDKFYNKLNDTELTDAEYEHVMNVWEHFHIRNLGEYADLYLKMDVLLMTDVFLKFRDVCMRTYEMDVCHFFSIPSFCFQAMLMITEIELELLTDPDMVMFLELSLRGGLVQTSKRFSVANNRYQASFDPTQEEAFLLYLDVNNLYGYAMRKSLPYADFRWLSQDEINTFNVEDYNEEDPIGYILQADIEIPQEIHDKTNDLPLLPEHRKPPGSTQTKLMATLYDKEKYILHIENLQQAIKHGARVKHIHKILTFKQKPFLRKYIDLNTNLRKAATNEFARRQFKLYNNCIYGKFCENLRKRRDIKLCNEWEGRHGARKLISSMRMKNFRIINENLIMVELKKTEVKYDRPLYLGSTILDLSKTVIYDFHYGYAREAFGDSHDLLYTDTDSLIYEVRGRNVYDIIKRDIHKFDTSAYPENNPFGMPRRNKKEIGVMSDENGGLIMSKFVALKAKMYSFMVEGVDGATKKAKGIKKNVLKTLTFEDYEDTLFGRVEPSRKKQCIIRAKNHQVFSTEINKKTLDNHDDKRFINEDGVTTIAWGHYKLSSPAAHD